MSPLIKHNDIIKIKLYEKPRKIDKTQLHKILLFNDNEEWISHRLINFNNELVLKGDFSNCFESANDKYAWGEVAEIKFNSKSIDPNTSAKLISYLSSSSLKIKNKIIKKVVRTGIYVLNYLNRYLLSFSFSNRKG